MQLALLELRSLQWWEARTGGRASDAHEYAIAVLSPLAGTAAILATLEHDTLLILALSSALGLVLLVRQRQPIT